MSQCPNCNAEIDIAGLSPGNYLCPKCDGLMRIDGAPRPLPMPPTPPPPQAKANPVPTQAIPSANPAMTWPDLFPWVMLAIWSLWGAVLLIAVGLNCYHFYVDWWDYQQTGRWPPNFNAFFTGTLLRAITIGTALGLPAAVVSMLAYVFLRR